jgi:futalosine hydrolase
MSFKILYVSATSSEAEALKMIRGLIAEQGEYRISNTTLTLLVAGVGSMSTSWAMTKWLSSNPKPDLVINAGIAGSFKEEFSIGDVVLPVTDRFADSGIEDGENYLTLFEAGLANAEEFPFRSGIIHADPCYSTRISNLVRPVNAITVNTATGSEATKNRLLMKFNPDIETMEGATFFYICSREKIPFLALRAVSNMVEPRNKAKWNIPFAIERLSEKLGEIILTLV